MWERESWELVDSHSARGVAGVAIQFTVILEISGSCFLREMRRQVASRKKILLLLAL